MDDDLKLVERLNDEAEFFSPNIPTRPIRAALSEVDCRHLDGVSDLLSNAATTITRLHAEITQMTNTIDGLEFQLNEARAEIERLESDVSDLVRAGSDEATENERLVKERDEALADNAKLRMMMEAREKLGEAFGVDMHKNATEAALEFAQREIDAIARAETAEAQRDVALEALRPFVLFFDAAIECWSDGHDMDGGDIQEIAARLGLLRETVFNSEVHTDELGLDAQDGDPWFVLSDEASAAIRAASRTLEGE